FGYLVVCRGCFPSLPILLPTRMSKYRVCCGHTELGCRVGDPRENI
ncbi:1761_t:CDS:1, partial [Funneliformis mosseae]